ncbi:MAG: NUDIX domain-containing protein [Bacteroidia bacterium]
MIKIFTLNKIIYLTGNQHNIPQQGIAKKIDSVQEMLKAYNELITSTNSYNEIYFYNENLAHLFDYFSSQFKIIEAAGGLVKNKNEQWLFIFRNGRWDLPKGKIEKGEAIKEAAIREVEEECGINELKIIKELPSTYHTYSIEEKNVLKRTYWFEMSTNYNKKLTPQLEEGITDVKWLSKNQLKQVIDNTYESIKDVLLNI